MFVYDFPEAQLQETTQNERKHPVEAGVGASVIIVNYNGGSQILSCLGSLQRHSRIGVEIIVVDNASIDGSPAQIAEVFPEVRLIQVETNLGFGGGSNLGAAAAQGEFLAFLNPDTTVEPGWLEALLAALEANPKAGLATAKLLLMGRPGWVNTCGNDIHLAGFALCRGMDQPTESYSQTAEVASISGAAFAVRRSLFEQLGGFDPTFFLYMEDTDLSWRARLAGWQIVFVPQSVVYHDYLLNFGPQKTFYQERNRYLMLLKNLRWRTLMVLLPGLLLGEVIAWGFVITRQPDQWRGKLAAYAWIARNWETVMHGRQSVQSLRRMDDSSLLREHSSTLAFEQTGTGLAAQLAHLLFDPLFWGVQRMAARLVLW
jgi:GT2 family glycosyltransferase